MENAQLPKNGFVREQIKNKPKNRKRLVYKAAESALCGLVFALVFGVTLYILRPFLQGGGPDGALAESEQGSVEPSTEEPTQTPESESTQAAPTVVEVPNEITLADYQRLQSELYVIGNKANKSIVTVTGVVSDTDWFNNSYEREGLGSGTILEETDNEYLILTERKVISDASKISVTFLDDTVAPAELAMYDGNTGIAILSVKKSGLESSTKKAVSVIPMGSSSAVYKGMIVIALGAPLGTNYSILTGSITATNNEISTVDSNYSVFTTDIVASKNGSGVLINTEGELVGIVMQDYGTSSANTLTAVAVSEIKPVISLLFDRKEIPHLGLYVSTVTDKISNGYGLPKGVYVKDVEIDSPAMNAGLQSGDIIVEVAGETVTSDSAYYSALLAQEPGESCSVVVMRQGGDGYSRITCQVEPDVID